MSTLSPTDRGQMIAGSSPAVPPCGATGGSLRSVTPEQAPPAPSRRLGNGVAQDPAATAGSGADFDERDRIAAELSNNIVHRLFAAGLSLNSAASRLRTSTTVHATSLTAGHIDDAIRILDETINEIRTILFPPTERRLAEGDDLLRRLQAIITDMAAVLGFPPSVFLAAALGGFVPQELGNDLVIALRESLANVVRHACARSVSISVEVTPGRLTLEVTDDGVGISTKTRNRGLREMRQRAEHHSGSFSISTSDCGGTRVVWSVPM
ncbi:sensor histidine kinase [Pseudonocardia halophobica]|uniref:sensor histidine kinase n=1 Tax=Pseudonocardia halophobica TaxID=29401 RepID=UPI003D90938A